MILNKINTRNEDIRPHFWYFSLWCNFFIFYINNAIPICIIGLSVVVDNSFPIKFTVLTKVIIVLANLIKSVFIRRSISSDIEGVFSEINKSVFNQSSVRIKEVLLSINSVKVNDPLSFVIKIIDVASWAGIEGVFLDSSEFVLLGHLELCMYNQRGPRRSIYPREERFYL